MKRYVIALVFALTVTWSGSAAPPPLSAHAAEPPLRVAFTLARSDDLRGGQLISATAFVFSTSAVTSTVALEPPSWIAIDAAGPAEVQSALDQPARVDYVLRVLPHAPAGALGIVRATARDDQGLFASQSVTVRACCKESPPPTRPAWQLYFPAFY